MSIALPQAETRVVLHNVEWPVFEALARSDRGGARFAYDRGALEIMSPSLEHERVKKSLARTVELMTMERNIPILGAGSTTLKATMQQRGLEPDECYYVANEPRVRDREALDLAIDPPPDLAIEVDITASSLDQLAIYADLGVPEVWIHDGRRLHAYHLQHDGSYVEQGHSLTFPFLPLDEFQEFFSRRYETDETTWCRTFREWVKKLRQ